MELKLNQILTQWGFCLITLLLTGLSVMLIGCQGARENTMPPAPVEQSLSEQISLIDGAKAPNDVDVKLWQRLTSQLSSDLQQRFATQEGKLVSSVPSSDSSKTFLSIENARLSWGYYNQADYDQNGEVGLSDLTPIALNFGLTGPFAASSAKAIIDGDSNSEVNLADITPIAVNFLNSALGGYNIYQSMDQSDAPATNTSPNGSGALFIGNIRLDDATGNKANHRLGFSFQIPAPVVDAYYWVRPTDGEIEGTPSNLVKLDPPPNYVPMCIVSAAPDSGDAPLVVSFDGSLSSDPDGEIVDYSWDFDGPVDGYVWVSSGTDPSIQHTYVVDGTYQATLQVTDDVGASANSTATVIVGGPPPNEPPVADLKADPISGDAPLSVEFDASTSNDPDGSIVKFEWDWDGDGTYEFDSEAVSLQEYIFNTAGEFNTTVRVTDNLGATDTDTVMISVGASDKQWYTSTIKPLVNSIAAIDLLEVDGKPAVAFSDLVETNKIFYSIGNDAVGNTWGTAQEVGHEQADWLTLVTTGNHPAIIYRYEGFYGGFVRANNPQGSSWATRVDVDPGFGMMTMVTRWAGAVVDGKPSLAYKGNIGAQDGLFYQSATSLEGTVWNSANLITAIDPAFYPALLEVNGNPALIFIDSGSRLNYVRATNPAGSAWLTPKVIDPEDSFGSFPEIAIVNGNPAILYPGYGDFNSTLNYVRATDADGDLWETNPVTIYGDLDFAPMYPSFAIVNGNPAAAFGALGQSEIKYHRSVDQNGANWGSWERATNYSYMAIAFADINGHPGIAYLQNGFAGDDLMFAIYY